VQLPLIWFNHFNQTLGKIWYCFLKVRIIKNTLGKILHHNANSQGLTAPLNMQEVRIVTMGSKPLTNIIELLDGI